MAKGQEEKPQVVKAKITRMDHNYNSAAWEISMFDQKTGEEVMLILYESEMEGLFLRKDDGVMLWRTPSGGIKYVAHKEKIIEPRYSDSYVLNGPTQAHFDGYMDKLNGQWALKQELVHVAQQIAAIKSIDSSGVEDRDEADLIEDAKKSLMEYLDTKAALLRGGIKRRIK